MNSKDAETPITSFSLNELIAMSGGEKRPGLLGECIAANSPSQMEIFRFPGRLDAFVIGVCTEGETTFTSNLKEYRLKKDSLFIVGPKHILQIQSNNGFKAHVLVISPDFLRRINWKKRTVMVNGREYPMRDTSFPTVDPADPTALNSDEKVVLQKLVQSFRQSEKLQQHVEFLYAKGSVYHIENGNLLYHGAVPMTRKGTFAVERFEGHAYSGRALMDYCDERARRGYFAPEGSAARQSGQDFLWYLWCGKLSPLYGRSAMTTFERLYVEDASTHTEVKDPYYTWYNEEAVCRRILAEFGLPGTSHIVNGHVPVQEKKGESPIKGGGRLVVIDGGFCRAYHEKTGIAGYTLVYSSRTMSLRTHQPFESAEKAVNENLDILSQKNILETENHRILVEETDEGETLREKVHDLKQLVRAYQLGWIKETRYDDSVW